jgi:glutamate/tyrosine decarboxylase-like PLP-dependent enzyme
MVDDMMTYLESVRERPVWRPMSDDAKAMLRKPLPETPQRAEDVYKDFIEGVLPYPLGNLHPRFWGWVIGSGTPLGMLAELLASGMNPNLGGADHAANYVERQVLEWCKEMLGYPREASGLLVSGGSMANLVGLTVARNTTADFDLRRDGVQAAPLPMTFYASTETHNSVQKAIELLGLGSAALRYVPVNDALEIEIPELEAAISKDRDEGRAATCVVGNAGTVNTGAFDDLEGLADLCRREDLWFHVDGAFGALAALSPQLCHLVKGMERADSLAFDLHKWMYMPIEIGCALVKDEESHRRAFSLDADYTAKQERGAAAGAPWFSDYGVQLSRGFRALKAWMSMKEHGIEKYGRLIRQNVDQARYLARMVEESPQLELLAPVPLNIVCFRYVADGPDLDELNHEILVQLHESGVAVPSYTKVSGKFAIRVANTNHRSRREDFDLLVQEVLRIGTNVAAKMG